MSMWPDGVRSVDDMVRFCRLMVGDKADLQNYSHRMPVAKKYCWLFFSRGGCAKETALAPLEDCVPGMMDELIGSAQQNGNYSNPEIAFQTGSRLVDSWYDSAQLSRSRCICRINFGGEGKSKSRKHLSADCQAYTNGRKFEKMLLSALQQNSRNEAVGPSTYLDKAFHALLNRNRHMDQHRIGWHSDEYQGSYLPDDPITSLSWGATGVLLIRLVKGNAVKVVVAEPGDVTLMGGMFQQTFQRAVPAVRDWRTILDEHEAQLQEWEIAAMESEIQACNDREDRIRYNITVRWHNFHKGCPNWNTQVLSPEEVASSPPIHESTNRFLSAGVSSAQQHVYKLGTGYRPIVCQLLGQLLVWQRRAQQLTMLRSVAMLVDLLVRVQWRRLL